MLSIKHIQPSGEETIYASPIVNYVPTADFRRSPPTLWIEPVGHSSPDPRLPLTGGICFVMNENGKTVSRYDLGDDPRDPTDYGRNPDHSA
ncbi:hypothetical protein ACFFTN_01355 [Aminobacter aganoensis]|uniref:Uncharacterized protein n=1 Tax=Aminobacter aganoensis TaxID=83264 RepID=A0A7X0F5M3_9HYPH|nr:hypothetical protein [Aminobacter aganoensis]MBB6353494.1 hypothetical protein [Aminobacter aganoensis]